MTESLIRLPALSLYIHIPWCVRKCPYCDFNSHTQKTELPEQAYIEALLADLDQDLPHIQNRPIQNIFIGGGTPSLFSGESYRQLFNGLRQRVSFADDIEITLEANPGTAEQERFTAYRQAGINRLSLGVQSFNSHFLKGLGRIHDGDEALNAVAMARQAGFENLNLDLMFGLPDQSPEQGLNDLETAIKLKPAHISWYQLTLEPNTVFHRYPPTLPQDDDIVHLQEAGARLLTGNGFDHYETSAWASPGRQCRHNLNYWQFGDYLGLGAGAHGKITHPELSRLVRTRKTRQPDHYLNAVNYCTDSSDISSSDLPLEFMMNAMRLSSGSTLSDFEQATGQARARVLKQVRSLQKQSLLEESEEAIRPTARGRLFLNDLLLAFMPD